MELISVGWYWPWEILPWWRWLYERWQCPTYLFVRVLGLEMSWSLPNAA